MDYTNSPSLPKEINFRLIYIILSGTTLVALVLMLIFGLLNLTSRTSTLTVIGESNTSVKAEQVSLIATKVNISESVNLAIDQGEIAIKKLIEVAKIYGGNDAEIKKSFFQITPQADGQYIVANAISIKSSKINDVNNLIKQLYNYNATTVSNVSFEAKDSKSIEQEVRITAIKDANEKAKRIAKAASKKLGKLISIEDDNAPTSSSIKDMDSDASSISINKKVSIVYEIR